MAYQDMVTFWNSVESEVLTPALTSSATTSGKDTGTSECFVAGRIVKHYEGGEKYYEGGVNYYSLGEEDCKKVRRLQEYKNMRDQTPKGSQASGNRMKIGIRPQNGKRMRFTISPDIKLYEVFKIFAKIRGMSMSRLRFRFEGEPIGKEDTPTSMGMEPGDTIEAFLE